MRLFLGLSPHFSGQTRQPVRFTTSFLNQNRDRDYYRAECYAEEYLAGRQSQGNRAIYHP